MVNGSDASFRPLQNASPIQMNPIHLTHFHHDMILCAIQFFVCFKIYIFFAIPGFSFDPYNNEPNYDSQLNRANHKWLKKTMTMAVLAMAPPIIEEMRPNFSKSFTLNGPIHKIRYLYLILIAFTLCMKMPVFFLLCQLCFSARFHIFAAAVIIAVATYTSDSEIKPAFLFCVFFSVWFAIVPPKIYIYVTLSSWLRFMPWHS